MRICEKTSIHIEEVRHMTLLAMTHIVYEENFLITTAPSSVPRLTMPTLATKDSKVFIQYTWKTA